MKDETNKFIDELLKVLEFDERVTYLKNKKEILLSNKELISKINKLKTLDIYSSEYKNLKQELFKNPDFVEFKQVENEINLLILEINKKLNNLTDERGYNCENN